MRGIKQKMQVLACAALLASSLTAIAQDPPPATAPAPTDAASAPVEASAAATPAAEAPLAEAKTESVENPYGIGALWAQGDFVARFVLVAMLIMSGATWYIMVVKYIDQSKLMRQAKA
ncbi:MAG: outer rane transport energization protein ExbB, partial [Hydrocarboniphaga sp.]|nr:outer rane transport energization protein ExbB [Hydrocarboniphaga sp.]